MLEQKTLMVGKKEWVIQQLPASRAIYYAVKIGKILSGASVGIGAVKAEKFDLGNLEIDFGAVITGLFERIDEEDSARWITGLIGESLITPKFTQDLFDSSFSGALDELVFLVGEILRFNYSETMETLKKRVLDFFGRLFPAEETRDTPN